MTVAVSDLLPIRRNSRAACPVAGKLMTVPISFAPACTAAAVFPRARFEMSKVNGPLTGKS